MPSVDPQLVQQVANTYRLPADLLTAQIQIESAGDPRAFRYEPVYYERYIADRPGVAGYAYGPLAACSYGLLQILLETAIEIGYSDRPEQLFVPQVGLNWGARQLRHLWDGLGGGDDQYPRALARYNGAGPAALLYADRVYRAAGRR